MALLGRDDILKAEDLSTEDVQVPEWGGEVRVKGLSGTARDRLEASTVEQRGKSQHMNMVGFRARLLAESIVDEDGKRVFAEKDINALGDKSALALQRVVDVALKLSGMSEEDVEELTEGFDNAQSDDSTSD